MLPKHIQQEACEIYPLFVDRLPKEDKKILEARMKQLELMIWEFQVKNPHLFHIEQVIYAKEKLKEE